LNVLYKIFMSFINICLKNRVFSNKKWG